MNTDRTAILGPWTEVDTAIANATIRLRAASLRFGLTINAETCKRVNDEWARTLESYRKDLLRFVYCLERDRCVAEDVVEETLLRAWRARGDLRSREAIRGWLFIIARREHARLYEKKGPLFVGVEEDEDGVGATLEPQEEDDRIGDLGRALLNLSDSYRLPLVMQVLGGFSTAEIAAELGLTVNAVLTRLYRARAQLRERMETCVLPNALHVPSRDL